MILHNTLRNSIKSEGKRILFFNINKFLLSRKQFPGVLGIPCKHVLIQISELADEMFITTGPYIRQNCMQTKFQLTMPFSVLNYVCFLNVDPVVTLGWNAFTYTCTYTHIQNGQCLKHQWLLQMGKVTDEFSSYIMKQTVEAHLFGKWSVVWSSMWTIRNT
jgi:hypothetical protein